ncbi:MAG: RNA polymerase sigma factor [Candidatus Doudnabacteria bacterium]
MLSKEKQFELLFHQCSKSLSNFLVSRFGYDKENVEDIVQETFVKAYLKFERFDQSRSFKAWLFGIGINTAKGWKYKFFEPLSVVSDVQLVAYYNQENPELVFERQSIISALACLKDSDREILELVYFQGLSLEQVAKKLKKPISSVKQRINRALKHLSVEVMVR